MLFSIKLDRDSAKKTHKTTGRQYGKATITENRCHLRTLTLKRKPDGTSENEGERRKEEIHGQRDAYIHLLIMKILNE